MKISAEKLLQTIEEMGAGTLEEYRILRRLDISHGQFCKLRKELVTTARLIVTHPNRKAFYIIPCPTQNIHN